MGNVNDILIDLVGGDLKIDNGDFVIDESTAQHQYCILLACNGDYKHDPMLGVDALNYINEDNVPDIMREVRMQFTKDGMRVDKADYKNGVLNIIAHYDS